MPETASTRPSASPCPPPRRIGEVSFWYREEGLPSRRPPLPGPGETDICIIGAGFTGLWTAYYLRRARPDLAITLLEKEFAGFGASGRNGGWLTGGFAWNHARYAGRAGEAATRAMVEAMNGTVAEVLAIAREHGIAADIVETDELEVAFNPAQLARAEAEARHRALWGEAGRIEVIDAAALARRLHLPGALGALRIAGVARIQPVKFVRALARVVEGMGVTIHEGTEVLHYGPGRVRTAQGELRARVILRCTEGFTATLPGHRRDWLPLNSAQIVTAPLPESLWQEIGWQGHELVGSMAHGYSYSQRTADGRITMGARGVPYRFASRLDRNGTPDGETIRRLIALLHRQFPATRGHAIDHAWCGVLGVPRDWCASLGFDPATGLGFAGGYVGVGLSTSNLAGRTLADLALGRESGLTRLPWVNHPPRRWEPEPLRWLGVRGMYALLNAADRAEDRSASGRPSRLAALGYRLAGRG